MSALNDFLQRLARKISEDATYSIRGEVASHISPDLVNQDYVRDGRVYRTPQEKIRSLMSKDVGSLSGIDQVDASQMAPPPTPEVDMLPPQSAMGDQSLPNAVEPTYRTDNEMQKLDPDRLKQTILDMQKRSGGDKRSSGYTPVPGGNTNVQFGSTVTIDGKPAWTVEATEEMARKSKKYANDMRTARLMNEAQANMRKYGLTGDTKYLDLVNQAADVIERGTTDVQNESALKETVDESLRNYGLAKTQSENEGRRIGLEESRLSGAQDIARSQENRAQEEWGLNKQLLERAISEDPVIRQLKELPPDVISALMMDKDTRDQLMAAYTEALKRAGIIR